MGAKIRIPGINIQYPWSELILSGEKRIETRSYPIPKHLLNVKLAIIETKRNKGKPAQIVGIINFTECYQYKDYDHWASEYDFHKVPKDDPLYGFRKEKEKWAWLISESIRIPPQAPPKKRGIKYAKECEISL